MAVEPPGAAESVITCDVRQAAYSRCDSRYISWKASVHRRVYLHCPRAVSSLPYTDVLQGLCGAVVSYVDDVCCNRGAIHTYKILHECVCVRVCVRACVRVCT